MTQPIRTAEEAIAWQTARLGLSRLDAKADWDAGPNIDDCALFQSKAVYGEWVAWNVDALIGHGAFTRGKSGLRRGDLVLFEWDGDGVGDHVEMALSSPDASGRFATIGANRDSTFAVRTGTRNQWVKGYVRPAYPTTTPAGGTVPPPKPQEEDMGKFVQHRKPNLTVAYVGPDLSFTVLEDMDEVRSIEALGLAKQSEMVRLTDDLIWEKLSDIAARKPS
jgi:hypothetical protein